MYIFSHNARSEGASVLAKRLDIKRIKHENSLFRGNPRKVVINWGATELPLEVKKCTILNTEEAVATCSNKLAFFNAVEGACRTPKFTTDRDKALKWINNDGVVFCRTLLRASAGRGIVEANDEEDLVDAPLYTRYIPKRNEYRIHICKGEVFLVQRKAFRSDIGIPEDEVNWRVRNHANGFVFARNEGHEPEKCVIDEAIKAFNKIGGLTFGSVDVIYNEHRNKAYVLEINTASGLSGETVDDYVKMIGRLM